jgi:hypothetical protein
LALSRAEFKAGSNIAARIAIIAITTNSSIRVKILIELAFALRASAFATLRRDKMVGEASDSINVKREDSVPRPKRDNRDVFNSLKENFIDEPPLKPFKTHSPPLLERKFSIIAYKSQCNCAFFLEKNYYSAGKKRISEFWG